MKKRISVYIAIFWLFAVSLGGVLLFRKQKIETYEQTTILQLWQIDSVEGGKGSRRQYLEKIARIYEKTNANVLITVINQTVIGAEENFKKGVYPDMISFSQGLNGVFPFVKELNVPCDLAFGGKVNGILYAYPWAYGGYVYITREGQNTVSKTYLSKGDYNLPLAAAFLAGYDLKDYEELPPSDAYYAFLNDHSSALIGTQRDLYRLQNKNLPLKVEPIGEYTDIVQYISVIKGDIKREASSVNFLKVLAKNNEKVPDTIGMLSNVVDIKNADNRPIDRLLGVKYRFVPSCFSSLQTINELNDKLNDENLKSDNKMKFLKSTIIYLK